MQNMPRSIARALGAALLLCAAIPGLASAHERREVGPYQFIVGFTTEPAIVNEPNGVDLRITDRATGQPVEGAESTLEVSVAYGGGEPKQIPLRARFGQPGAYLADLIPTRAGSYIFNIGGTVGETPVNERFESGPGRFNDVQSAESLQIPSAAASTAELQQQVRTAEQRADQATTYAMVGAALGLLGLIVGVTALMRRPTAASRPATTAR